MTGRTPTRRRAVRVWRRAVAIPLIALCAVTATGCSSGDGGTSVAQQAAAGDRKGYVSGDGTISTLPPDQRGAAVDLAGELLDGSPWSLADAAGDVVVVNKWGSWCPPCVAETPELVSLWQQLQADEAPVQLVGLNFRETPATGAAFARSAGMDYPSLSDEDGILTLALQGRATATPSTVILDRAGRIAAWVVGATDASTLGALVDDVVAEQ